MTGQRGYAVGITLRDLPDPPDGADALVGSLRQQGIQLTHVPSPMWFTPTLDESVLDAIGARLAAEDLVVAVGLGALNAHHLERAAAVAQLGDGDPVRGWQRVIAAAGRLGASSLHFTIGVSDDRFDRGTSWREQMTASVALLRRIAPVAAALGIPLVLKTHEEMTSSEAVRMVEAIGPDTVRIGYSPVNVLARLEDPVAAARRVAPYLHTLFLDDAVVSWTPAGMARTMTAVGEGTVDWAGILDAVGSAPTGVPIVLDLHRAELDMPFYQPGWTSDHPEMTSAELLAIAAGALPITPAPATLEHRRDVGLARLTELRLGTWPAFDALPTGDVVSSAAAT